MALYRYRNKAPQLPASAYVAAEATLIGDVTLGEGASLWPGAVARGDNEPVRIGEGSNVQEGAVLHADPGYPLTLADNVSVGHQAMIHGCSIGEGSLVGIQAIILNGAKIGKNCLVGAGALITEGKEFPDNSLILGAPARAIRTLNEADVANLQRIANSYVERAREFKDKLKRIG